MFLVYRDFTDSNGCTVSAPVRRKPFKTIAIARRVLHKYLHFNPRIVEQQSGKTVWHFDSTQLPQPSLSLVSGSNPYHLSIPKLF